MIEKKEKFSEHYIKEQSIVASGDSVENKAEKGNKFFEKIKQEVDIAKSLLKFVEEHKNDDIPALQSACKERKQEIAEIFAGSSEGAEEHFLKLEKLDGSYEHIKEKIKSIEESRTRLLQGQNRADRYNDGSQENKDIRLLGQALQKALERAQDIQKRRCSLRGGHRDAIFAREAKRFLNGLVVKRKAAISGEEAYSADPKAFFHQLKIGGRQIVEPKDKVRVNFSGFDINIILTPDEFKLMTGDPRAFACHIPFSVVNLFRDTNENLDQNIEHEIKHGLLELLMSGNNIVTPLPQDFLADIQRNINEFDSLGFAEVEFLNAGIEKSIQASIKNYIFDIFQELVVDIDAATEIDRSSSFFLYISEVSEGLSRFLNSPYGLDPDLKKTLSNSYEIFKKQFATLLDELSIAFFVGRKTGKLEDVKMALVVLSSKEIIEQRKLTEFIEYLVGKQQYDLYSGIEGLAGADLLFATQGMDDSLEIDTVWVDKLHNFFEPINIKKIANILQTSQENPRPEEKERQKVEMTISMMRKLDRGRLAKILENIDDFPGFYGDIQVIAKKLDLNALVDFVDDIIRPKFEFIISGK